MRFINRLGKYALLSRHSTIETLEPRFLMTTGLPTVVDIEVASTAWTAEFLDFVNGTDDKSIGYSIPLPSAQLNSLTWTNIDKIILRFSEDVYIDSADLSISGVNSVTYEFSDFHYDPIDHVATWTLETPLDQDRVQIDLDTDGANPVRDIDLNKLDGEWITGISLVSGNGTAGGDFQFVFNIQPTDVNNSGRISSTDFSMIYQVNGKTIGDVAYKALRDIDGDGAINANDWQEALNRYTEDLPAGNPIGLTNDAPTTTGFGLVRIDDAVQDVVLALAEHFNDLEGGANGLTYTVLSSTNDELFDYIAIDPLTKQLVVNAADGASGRSAVVIRATDASGLSVDALLTIDVNYQNQPPIIEGLQIVDGDYGTLIVYGWVIDADDDVSNFIVNFSGVFDIRSAVEEDGFFMFAVHVAPGEYGPEEIYTTDPHGLNSATLFRNVGILT
jgi:Dockerin type I domain